MKNLIALLLISTTLAAQTTEESVEGQVPEHATPYPLEHTPRQYPEIPQDAPYEATRDIPPPPTKHSTPYSLQHTPRSVSQPPPPSSGTGTDPCQLPKER